MKKALSIILCLAMLMTTVPMSVFAAPAAVTAGDSALEFVPELSIDDVILVKERDTYEEGNIVVYQSGYTLIVHKIIRIEDEDHVVTKGTANEGEDDPIRMKDIKGEVFFDIPYLGLIVSILKTPIVTFLLLAVAVYLLIRSYQNERVRDNREMDAIRQEIQRLKGGGEQSIEDIKAEIQRLKEEQQSTEQK